MNSTARMSTRTSGGAGRPFEGRAQPRRGRHVDLAAHGQHDALALAGLVDPELHEPEVFMPRAIRRHPVQTLE